MREPQQELEYWIMDTLTGSMWKERLSPRTRGVEADACIDPLTRAVEEDDNRDCEEELESIYESIGPDDLRRG